MVILRSFPHMDAGAVLVQRVVTVKPDDQIVNFENLWTHHAECIIAGKLRALARGGGVQKKKAGRLLDGRTWDEMPKEITLARA
ncbi:MAG: hypothetical protein Kow0070_31350 [Anaerolineales bacterium]